AARERRALGHPVPEHPAGGEVAQAGGGDRRRGGGRPHGRAGREPARRLEALRPPPLGHVLGQAAIGGPAQAAATAQPVTQPAPGAARDGARRHGSDVLPATPGERLRQLQEPAPVAVLEVEDRVELPVEVACEFGRLRDQRVRRRPHHSPDATSSIWLRSTSNATPHDGQSTRPAASLSELMRSYSRCRWSKSAAYRPSTSSGVIAVWSPIRMITRESRSTLRYASFSRTAGSRSGSSSSRAVARRMTPSRCTAPDGST